MAKIIVFEGADGTGKTTLISNILKLYPQVELFFTPRNPSNVDDDLYFLSLLTELGSGKTYLIDRCFHSNWTYNKMRDPAYDQSADLARIKTLQAEHELTTIVLTREPKSITDDLISLSLKQDKRVLELYAKLCRVLGLKQYCALTSEGLTELVELINLKLLT